MVGQPLAGKKPETHSAAGDFSRRLFCLLSMVRQWRIPFFLRPNCGFCLGGIQISKFELFKLDKALP